MDKTEPKYRRKLNAEQLEVLKLLYKFRFGSNDLIAQYFGKKDRSFVFKRLKILLEQGLIDKRFESSYRIQGKPAAYYLLPDGARALQEHQPDKPINMKVIYKSKTVSEDFVEYCLKVFGVYCQFKVQYGDDLKFLTSIQLAKYDYFSEFVPGAYLRFNSNGTEKDFFLEYLSGSKPFFTFIRRLKQYSDYFDSGEWEDGTNSEFPAVLLVCDTPSLQKRLLNKSGRVLEDVGDGLEFYLITEGHLKQGKDTLWTNLADPDEVHTLQAI